MAGKTTWCRRHATQFADEYTPNTTDPDTSWCLARIGVTPTERPERELDAVREAFRDDLLGFADLVLVSIATPSQLRERRPRDQTRRRHSFELDARLAEPLRDWYRRLPNSRLRSSCGISRSVRVATQFSAASRDRLSCGADRRGRTRRRAAGMVSRPDYRSTRHPHAHSNRLHGPDQLSRGHIQRVAQNFRLFLFPVVLGRGRRLFDDATGVPALRLLELLSFRSGTVLLRYGVAT